MPYKDPERKRRWEREHVNKGTRGAEHSAYLGLGDKEQALRWLERAYDEQDPWLFWLKTWPPLDPLRSEARFQALLRRVNFPQ